MRTAWTLSVLLTGCLCVLAPLAADAVEVKLQVAEPGKVARSGGAVTSGVPFAAGVVKDVAKLAVAIDGKRVPAQFTKLAQWPDGSIRWALMDVQVDVPAGGRAELVVSDSGGNPAPAAPVAVQDGPDAVKVSTGPMQFAVSKKAASLLSSLTVDGKELVGSAGRGVVLVKEDGGQLPGTVTSVAVEQAGPLRAVVCVKGKFAGVHNDLLSYTARISAFAGHKSVKVHLWLENAGAMGYFQRRNDGDKSDNVEWFAFDGLAVELGLGLGETVTASCEGVQGVGGLKVLQVHKMAKSQEKEKTKKPPYYTWNDFDYTITAPGQEPVKGDRTDGVVEMKGSAGSLTAAIRYFWQEYEKAIELEGKTLRVWLWPTEGQWPRPRPNLRGNELYDKNLQVLTKEGLYLLAGAVHKGHEFMLDFSGRPAGTTSADLSSPLFALASADYYASTGAAPGLIAPPAVRTGDREADIKLDSWMRMIRSIVDPQSQTGLLAARPITVESNVSYFNDSTYWFGWMDFGDLAVPGRGPVGLHYDWTWLLLVSALQTGDAGYLSLATPAARHRVDVDQLWSDRDPVYCRGIQRADSAFPAFHCYRLYGPPTVRTNWLAGVVLYHMLTGEPKALDCARRNGDGLAAAWDHIATAKPYGGAQGDMAANAWAIESFCAMFDLTADRKWLDQALNLFNTNVVAKWKAHGPFLHDAARQIQSQDYIQDDMKYCYALGPLCTLHDRTGDETVMKLLTEGCQQEFPDSFFEAPLFVAGLYAYVASKTGDGKQLDMAKELFCQGFPMSKVPPVFLPNNSTWSRTSAMMLRAGHLLQYGAWKAKATP